MAAPKLKRPLYGPDHKGGPTVGYDSKVIKWGLYGFSEKLFSKPKAGFDPIYNKRTENAVKMFQHIKHLPQTGVVDQATFNELWPHLDPYRKMRYRLFQVPKPPPAPVKLVEPLQGWGSLHRSLWEAYSIGRSAPYNFSDLGTYNPASRLPSGAPSDHAVYPAYAFDLGIHPAIGYDLLSAREFFLKMTKRPEVHYVILGNKIWSTDQGLHGYYGGDHYNHIHVSGKR